MVTYIRQAVKGIFFKGPYKVKPLHYFAGLKYRNGIHEPEGHLEIIKEEVGAAFWYSAPRFLYNDSTLR